MKFSYDAICDGWVVRVFACIAEVDDLKCYLATVKWILINNFRTHKGNRKGL
jgi:hypothetical protein